VREIYDETRAQAAHQDAANIGTQSLSLSLSALSISTTTTTIIEQQLSLLREAARAIVTFSGIAQFRVPGQTHARLVQLEAFMV
jgi:hypothetical protein